MKYIQYIVFSLLGLLLAGCSDNDIPSAKPAEGDVRIEGDKVILTAAFDVPGFREVSSRAFDETPTLADLKLYIVEFVDNGSPLNNTLSAVYRPSVETVDASDSKVIYTVTLNKTDQPRVLHLLAVADDDLQIPYGMEGSVMPGLIARTRQDGIGQDAYWRRLVFPKGYCERETYNVNKERWVINQDMKDKLVGDEKTGPKNIKLVRNFAKVTVGIAEGVESFTLEDFIIVNTPDRGTMVPYSATRREFPEFLDENGDPLPYQTVAQNYSGISPANTELGNQVTSEDAPEMNSKPLKEYETTENGTTKKWLCFDPVYLFERPFNTISRTYIIIKGKYHNEVTNPKNESSYYKLDLGANDDNGIFRYFGLLRNFNYFIRITRVSASGYETAQAAAEGTVYNNISFDIDTDHLINMSDGKDIVRVNLTTAVITDKDSTLVFRYAYKNNIFNPAQENYNTYINSNAKFIGLEPGSVIKSVTPTDPNSASDTYINGIPWREVTIKCEDPTDITKTQEFTVVNSKTGLGRTITLVSHNKWDFVNALEFAGIWENYPETYNGLFSQNADGSKGPQFSGLQNSTYEEKCGTAVGSQFTIFFDIPDNIPEALFPLEFTIESNLQGLENEPMGTIVVAPGPSLFVPGENRIQYRKSVTWTEYNAPLRMDVRDDNGTALGNPEDGPVTHRVRCRFRTIETVADGTDVQVAIDNINFNMTKVLFKRTIAANSLQGPGLIYVEPSTNN